MGVTLIGISGLKGHGKDTVGQLLAEALGEQAVCLAIADPIKRACADWFGWPLEQLTGTDTAWKETPDPNWDGLTPRRAMQIIGTEIGRQLHSDVWIRETVRRAQTERQAGRCAIITDVRFDNEVLQLARCGGVLIGVERPGFRTGYGEAHASEQQAQRLVQEADYLITNDGTLDDLRVRVAELAAVLRGER